MISRDIDTVLYTLSGKADKAQGWGRARVAAAALAPAQTITRDR